MIFLVSGTTKSLERAMIVYPNRLGVLLTPSNRNSIRWVQSTGLPWAIDNGAYSGFDADGFRRLLTKAQGVPRLLWVACPDVVGDAIGTMKLFDIWEPVLRAAGVPVSFVGQDGQEDFPMPWERMAGLFIGGSTRWKLSEAAGDLVREAKRRGLLVHMGRVNSLRRMRVAHDIGCDSCDGSSASRWGDKYTMQYPKWIGRIQEQGRFHS